MTHPSDPAMTTDDQNTAHDTQQTTGRDDGHARMTGPSAAAVEAAVNAAQLNGQPKCPLDTCNQEDRHSGTHALIGTTREFRNQITAALTAAYGVDMVARDAEIERLTTQRDTAREALVIRELVLKGQVNAARAESAGLSRVLGEVKALVGGLDHAAVEKDGDSEFLIGYARASHEAAEQLREALGLVSGADEGAAASGPIHVDRPVTADHPMVKPLEDLPATPVVGHEQEVRALRDAVEAIADVRAASYEDSPDGQGAYRSGLVRAEFVVRHIADALAANTTTPVEQEVRADEVAQCTAMRADQRCGRIDQHQGMHAVRTAVGHDLWGKEFDPPSSNRLHRERMALAARSTADDGEVEK